MTVDTPVRPAIFVGQEQMTLAPAPALAQWERDLIARLEIERALHQIESMHPNETISGSGDGWDDCDYAR
ncbi:hypothetical protein Pth03_39480 [Planotetraspora thailandica]|uniref:Uncharacterized protein n=1 Tax=Planotetraspora thailandica TaxID=487172 RepID=A0A8J3V7T0_9ACTN|nr:hypothetical protein [Planotetraspora thailandica]GII55559.1 hypothetical protein Pth03_39480 [Planotetraspora thailandica]